MPDVVVGTATLSAADACRFLRRQAQRPDNTAAALHRDHLIRLLSNGHWRSPVAATLLLVQHVPPWQLDRIAPRAMAACADTIAAVCSIQPLAQGMILDLANDMASDACSRHKPSQAALTAAGDDIDWEALLDTLPARLPAHAEAQLAPLSAALANATAAEQPLRSRPDEGSAARPSAEAVAAADAAMAALLQVRLQS